MDDRKSASQPQRFASRGAKGRKKLVGKIDEVLEAEKRATVEKIMGGPLTGPRFNQTSYLPSRRKGRAEEIRDTANREGRPGDMDARDSQRGAVDWETLGYVTLFALACVVVSVAVCFTLNLIRLHGR